MQVAMPAAGEDVARSFYVDILGLEEEQKPPNLATRGGVWFRRGALRLHLGVDAEFRPAKKAHPALLVQGLEDIVTRCHLAGFQTVSDQPLDGYTRVYVHDPFGNREELMELRGEK